MEIKTVKHCFKYVPHLVWGISSWKAGAFSGVLLESIFSFFISLLHLLSVSSVMNVVLEDVCFGSFKQQQHVFFSFSVPKDKVTAGRKRKPELYHLQCCFI